MMKPISITNKTAKQVGEEYLSADKCDKLGRESKKNLDL